MLNFCEERWPGGPEHYGGPGWRPVNIVILNYILFLNERISIFYKVMSILSLEYFVCFFPETWWEFHDDVGEIGEKEKLKLTENVGTLDGGEQDLTWYYYELHCQQLKGPLALLVQLLQNQ